MSNKAKTTPSKNYGKKFRISEKNQKNEKKRGFSKTVETRVFPNQKSTKRRKRKTKNNPKMENEEK